MGGHCLCQAVAHCGEKLELATRRGVVTWGDWGVFVLATSDGRIPIWPNHSIFFIFRADLAKCDSSD